MIFGTSRTFMRIAWNLWSVSAFLAQTMNSADNKVEVTSSHANGRNRILARRSVAAMVAVGYATFFVVQANCETESTDKESK